MNLWLKGEKARRRFIRYSDSFLVYFPDRHRHSEIIENLETRYRVEEISFRTIFGEKEGYKVHAPRKIAKLIERQAPEAEIYNANVRKEVEYLAERELSCLSEPFQDRFDLRTPELKVLDCKVEFDDILNPSEIKAIRSRHFSAEGREKFVIEEFMNFIDSYDPDVILMEHADVAGNIMLEKCKKYGVEFSLSRGKTRILMENSYYSYGAVKHRKSAIIPEGRIFIDTASFAFREYGLKGILFTSRLTGLSANLTARFTPGTLISSYEVYEALKMGIAVPFRKRNPEKPRRIEELRINDKGGLVLQPEPGVYSRISQIDFTSMYPAIIVKYNLSPESIGNGKRGFLSTILEPLLNLRIKTKRLKKSDPEVAGIDSALKWMLVTCFGYTGFRNAKFGSISVHEKITGIGREILLKAIRIAEESGAEVIHAMVDSIFVRNSSCNLKEKIEKETGLLAEEDRYHWVVFLPKNDGFGAPARYYGLLESGEIKLRGVMARRRDTPEFIRRAQLEMFGLLGKARKLEELAELENNLKAVYRRHILAMKNADPDEFFIRKRISRTSYSRNSIEASAVRELKKSGIKLSPGMEVSYVVVDFKRKIVSIRNPESIDVEYYRKLLEKAYREVEFAVNFVREMSSEL